MINDIRKTNGGAILDPDDRIDDVLDDNDFVSIVLESDRPDPDLSEAEVRFVPSQVPGGKFEIPDVFLSLDGCSLAIDDLGVNPVEHENITLKFISSVSRKGSIQGKVDFRC